MRSQLLLATGAVALAAAAFPAAAAAKAPSVATSGVANIAPAGATLKGAVNPQGRPTSYVFQYGTTKAYGAQTAPVAAGAGPKGIAVAVAIAGLAPATRYQYRLVATNPDGATLGANRAFTTRKQPLGLSFAATPNPVRFGGSTVLAGALSGTGGGNQTVVLQQNPFPFTQGFTAVGNALVTDKAGRFTFPLLGVPLTTQYRVFLRDRPEIASPIVTVPVAVLVSTRTSRTRVRRGRKINFNGHIRPARAGAQVAVQKLAHGRWVTIAGTITHIGGKTYSRYSKSVRVPRGGSYRIFVGLKDGNYTSNVGRTVRIHSYR